MVDPDLVRGGCGSGSYLSILSMLKEKVGYPWTTLPDLMMSHAAAGYGGHGTLCGSLGGASCIINLVAYDEKQVFRQMIDRLYYWYAKQEFPTDRFDDIPAWDGTWHYRVTAIDTAGNESEPSAPVSVVVGEFPSLRGSLCLATMDVRKAGGS